MKTDAFGADKPVPKVADTKLPSNSPIAKAAAGTPAPAAAPAATQGIGGTDGATPAKAPAPVPAPLPTKDPNDKTPQMPAVTMPTTANPTAAPATSDGKPRPNDTRAEDFFASVRELGKAEGAGLNSRPELAIAVVSAVREGIVSPSTKSDDLLNIWNDFQKSKMEAANGVYRPVKADEAKVQLSKLRQFAKLGDPAHKFDGVRVLNRAREVIKNNKNIDPKAAMFDLLLKVARAQLDLVKADKATKAITDPQIKQAIVPAKADQELPEVDEHELSILTRTFKTISGLLDGSEDFGPRESKEMRTALELINKRKLAVEAEIQARKKEEGEDEDDAAVTKTNASPPPAQTNASAPAPAGK